MAGGYAVLDEAIYVHLFSFVMRNYSYSWLLHSVFVFCVLK